MKELIESLTEAAKLASEARRNLNVAMAEVEQLMWQLRATMAKGQEADVALQRVIHLAEGKK